MITCGRWPVGVCSWSLQLSLPEVTESMATLGVSHIHLDVGPVCDDQDSRNLAWVRAQAWTITATMIGFPQEDYSSLERIRETGGVVPDAEWLGNGLKG